MTSHSVAVFRWLKSQLGLSRLLLLSAALSCLAVSVHADTERQSYAIPEGKAWRTLKLVAKESGVDLVFARSLVRGVRTNPIQGEYTVSEAFEELVKGTHLAVARDKIVDAYTVHRRLIDEPLPVSLDNQKLTDMERNEIELRQLINQLKSAAMATGIALTAADIVAQESGEDEIFELSPFTVDGAGDDGYRATSTLAGSRLNTSLKDVASSVSVITRDFLEDTDSTDLKDLLVYTTGTEVAGLGGNLADASGQNSENEIQENPALIRATTRVRGLASATRTRNFYETGISMDSYNTQRVTVNRGANSILFGVGSPAGIIETSTIKPVFKDSNKVSFRYGSHESLRLNVDLERVINEKFSVRIAALQEEKKFQQHPAFERDQRVFTAFAWRPRKSTTISGNFESGSIKANLPRSIAPGDNMSFWFNPNAHPDGIAKASVDTGSGQGWGTIAPYYFGPWAPNNQAAIILNDPQSGALGWGSGGPEAHYVRTPSNWDPDRRGGMNLATLRGDGRNAAIVNGGVNEELALYFANNSITDESIIDFRNYLIDGPNKGQTRDFRAHSFQVEQLFFNNKAGLELAVNKEHIDSTRRRLFTGNRSFMIGMDVASTTPDGNVNPNFGRPAVSFASGDHRTTMEHSNTYRATGFFKLNASERTDGLLAKILGDHTITALYEAREHSNSNYSGRPYTMGAGWAEAVTRQENGSLLLGGARNLASGNARLGGIFYLGDSFKDADTISGANLTPVLPLIQVPDTIHVRIYDYNRDKADPSKTDNYWTNAPVEVIENPVTGFGIGGTHRDSSALIMNSSFLDGHLKAIYGWRKDSITDFAKNRLDREDPSNEDPMILIRDPVTRVFDPSDPRLYFPFEYTYPDDHQYFPGQTATIDPRRVAGTFEDTTFSWGVVAHAPQKIVDSMPGINSFSLHFASSENSDGNTAVRHNLFGERIPDPTGGTQEMGFSLSLFEGKLSLRANHYRTIQNWRSDGTLGAIKSLINFEREWVDDTRRVNITRSAAIGDLNEEQLAHFATYPDWPEDIKEAWSVRYDNRGRILTTTPSGFTATSDGISEGYEFEVAGKFTDKWSISFNATKSKVSRDNSAPDFARYLFEAPYNRWDIWQVGSLEDPFSTPNRFGQYPSRNGNPFNIHDRIRNNYIGQYDSAHLQDGSTSVDQIREWRANMVTRYRFANDGKLKGLTVGGSLRWQDEVAIGFPYDYSEELERYLPRVTEPWMGPDSITTGAFARYARKIRDGKINWTIQLNVSNVFNDEDLIPIKANPDGTIAVYRTPRSREWNLTNTFRF